MTQIPTLTTARLTLRAPNNDDFPAIAAFYASDRARRVAQRLGASREGMFLHERHGPLEIWRHPNAGAA